MTGQRRGFAPNTLHQVAVRTDCVDVEIEYFVVRPVEIRSQPPARDRHSHTVSYPLAERAGRCLYPGRDVRLRMSRGAAAQLAEALDLFQGDREFSEHLMVLIH